MRIDQLHKGSKPPLNPRPCAPDRAVAPAPFLNAAPGPAATLHLKRLIVFVNLFICIVVVFVVIFVVVILRLCILN